MCHEPIQNITWSRYTDVFSLSLVRVLIMTYDTGSSNADVLQLHTVNTLSLKCHLHHMICDTPVLFHMSRLEKWPLAYVVSVLHHACINQLFNVCQIFIASRTFTFAHAHKKMAHTLHLTLLSTAWCYCKVDLNCSLLWSVGMIWLQDKEQIYI